MCGIAGYWSRSLPTDPAGVLCNMTASLHHRGPDGAGHWRDDERGIGLGHRRLAIVDLSEAGAQPMVSAEGRYQVVYNGELYNHLVLREELEKAGLAPVWRGHSDTETLLAAFCAWGFDGALARLNGMYAIALWDRQNGSLSLARDRMGEKPLYYGVVGNHLVFASELRALREHPAWQAHIDSLAVARFLRYSSVPAPQTVYEGVFKLPAAHAVTLTSPATLATPYAYWSAESVALAGEGEAYGADDRLLDALSAQLAQSVATRMMSDVPFGAFLSGGVDSSLVVAMMQQASSVPVSTFSIGFEEASHNEAPFAREVATHLGTSHTEHYVSSQEALDVVPSLPQLWDEPFADSSQIPTYLVSRMARRDVTVCLTGDGGDELFAGYTRYPKALRIRQRVSGIAPSLRALLGGSAGRLAPPLGDLLASSGVPVLQQTGLQMDRLAALAEVFAAGSDDALFETLSARRSGRHSMMRDIDPGLVPLLVDLDASLRFEDRMLLRDMLVYLPDTILAKVDRASMAVSLETRAPMLDHCLVEFALRLPWQVKCHDGVGKWPLISLLRRYLPDAMIDRPKQGFGVPVAEWLRGPLHDWASDLMTADALNRHGLFDVKVVHRLWQQHQSRRYDWAHSLWNVLMLQAWLAEHG